MIDCKDCGIYCGCFLNNGLCDSCYDKRYNECDDCGKTISKSEKLCSECSSERHKERVRNL